MKSVVKGSGTGKTTAKKSAAARRNPEYWRILSDARTDAERRAINVFRNTAVLVKAMKWARVHNKTQVKVIRLADKKEIIGRYMEALAKGVTPSPQLAQEFIELVRGLIRDKRGVRFIREKHLDPEDVRIEIREMSPAVIGGRLGKKERFSRMDLAHLARAMVDYQEEILLGEHLSKVTELYNREIEKLR